MQPVVFLDIVPCGMRNYKIYKLILFLIMAGIILFIGISYLSQKKVNPLKKNQNTKEKKRYQYARLPQTIKGFKYMGYADSRQRIKIRCRHFAVHRKKIGFVRFKLMKQAVLYDADIQFFLYPEKKTPKKSGAATQNKVFDSQDNAGNMKFADVLEPEDFQRSFQELSEKDSPLFSKFHNISSILVRGITLQFYYDDIVISSISANSARLKLSGRKFFFTGNVTIISGKRKLMLDRLELNPDTMLLTGTDYTFCSPEGEETGHNITTDLILKKSLE